jgi:hypothetical protein
MAIHDIGERSLVVSGNFCNVRIEHYMIWLRSGTAAYVSKQEFQSRPGIKRIIPP